MKAVFEILKVIKNYAETNVINIQGIPTLRKQNQR